MLAGGLYTYAGVAGDWAQKKRKDPSGTIIKLQLINTTIISTVMAIFVVLIMWNRHDGPICFVRSSAWPIVERIVVKDGNCELDETYNNINPRAYDKMSKNQLIIPEIIKNNCKNLNEKIPQMTNGRRKAKYVKYSLKKDMLKCMSSNNLLSLFLLFLFFYCFIIDFVY